MPSQLLSEDGFDGALRRQGTTARAEKQMEPVPDLRVQLQRHQLEQPDGDTAQHDKTLARLPGPLNGLQMLCVRCLRVACLVGLRECRGKRLDQKR